MSSITELFPQSVWAFFDEITRIPRPSKKEDKIIAYLLDFARAHGLSYRTDDQRNVVILKPATAPREGISSVILQSHMDMVCEKNSDVQFDFEQDPIRTRIDGPWVKATDTTLGADCGIGMAVALAILADPGLEHGPLEVLFTVDEESGLTGAFGLGPEMLSGKYLINLDSEDEGELFIGCAGGVDTVAHFNVESETTPLELQFFRVELRGLQGGHSGDDINKGLGNSNKLLNRFLWQMERQVSLRLSDLGGGNLRNAIPREAFALFGVPVSQVGRVEVLYREWMEELQAEFGPTEPTLEASLRPDIRPEKVWAQSFQYRLLCAICGLPNGVLAMSRHIEGLVESSTNLASVKLKDHTLMVTTSQRSSIESAKRTAAASIRSVFELAGARVEHSDGYPGWEPNPDSSLLQLTRTSYYDLFGVQPQVKAIHAGLECGLFLQKFPTLEMVSFGPTIRGAHSPQERLEIASVEKFWKLLVEVLRRIDQLAL